jgi:hypothetical protein
MLHYGKNNYDGLFDMRERGVSYSSKFIRVMGYFALREGGTPAQQYQQLFDPFKPLC